MKLKNNIVPDSEMEITFDSFNPTEVALLLAFLASQSKFNRHWH